MKSLALLLCLLVSCRPEERNDFFTPWPLAGMVELEILRDEIHRGEEIELPRLAWVEVFRFKIWDPQFFLQSYCFLYKTPHLNSAGLMRIVKMDKGQCSQILQPHEEIQDVRHLKIEYRNFSLNFQYQQKIVGAWKERKERVSLYSLRKDRVFPLEKGLFPIASTPEFLAPSTAKSFLPGLLLHSFSQEQKETQLLAKIQSKGGQCHEVNPDCTTRGENSCQYCNEGWVEASGGGCISGGNKYCDQDCGGAGELACSLGILFFSGDEREDCSPTSLLGFCKTDAVLTCEGGELRCR